MRALSLLGPRAASLVDVAEPVPGQGEVLVRILACGVCGSDLNAWRGVAGIEYPLPPGAPGHETWGRIVAVGAGVETQRIGQTVTGLLWNGFAELGVGRSRDLLVVPTGLQSRPVLGEPLACAMNVIQRAAIQPGDRVAVVGFGYVAALAVQLLPADVTRWVAISRREDSRALALRLGAEAAYDFSNVPDDAWDAFPVVIEAAGVQQTLDYATWLTAEAGRLVIAGYHADGPRNVNMQSWNWKGIDVINAHQRQAADYLRALRAAFEICQDRRLDLVSLQTHNWPLEHASQAFEAAETRPAGFFKASVCP